VIDRVPDAVPGADGRARTGSFIGAEPGVGRRAHIDDHHVRAQRGDAAIAGGHIYSFGAQQHADALIVQEKLP
jgi:hypothetical protein